MATEITVQNASDTATLDTIKPGTLVVIKSLQDSNPQLYRKLITMGLVAGRSLKVLKSAPFGDPIAISTLGYTLSLRLSEARLITVSHLP
jgi:ferrous iron transport protein A